MFVTQLFFFLASSHIQGLQNLTLNSREINYNDGTKTSSKQQNHPIVFLR